MTTSRNTEQDTRNALASLGYNPDNAVLWVVEIVDAVLDADRERYIHSASVLRKWLDKGDNIAEIQRWAGFLLEDLGIVTEAAQ